MNDSYRPTRDWLYPQRFVYEPANEMWAAVWLEAPLDPGLPPPASPVLAVRIGELESAHPAFLSCTERLRADGTRPVPGAVPDVVTGYLLWRARFSVPLEVIEDPESQFILRSSDGAAVALPLPQPPEAIAGLTLPVERVLAAKARRGVAALAAGVAVAGVPVGAAAADTVPASTTDTSATTTTAAATTATATTPAPPTAPTTPDSGPAGTTAAPSPTTTTPTPPPTTTTTTATPPATTTSTPAPPSTPTTTTSTPAPAPPSTSPTPPAPTPNAPEHSSGGWSIPSPGPAAAAPAAKRSKSSATRKHKTSLRCTVSIPAVKKAKLSKRALARLERTLTKTKCAPAGTHKRHGQPRAVHRDAGRGHSIGGGAVVKPQPQPMADILTPGSTSLVGPNPAAVNAWSRLSLLFARGDRPPSFLVPMYRAAGRKYHVPWPVLAAINAIETDYGRDLSTSPAGAMGWMQFMPQTWMEYAVATGDHVVANPYDPRDAIFSAARYLFANGARHDLRRAISAYNHAKWYVDEVLWTAADIIEHARVKGSRARVKLAAMQAMALALEGEPYEWGGGHAGWEISAGYDCSGFVSAVLHAGGYLRTPVTTQALPLQRDLLQGPGRYITIFDRTNGGALDEDHVIIDLHGQWWESGGIAGAGVHRIKHVSASYLLTFNQILHPRAL